MKYAMHTGRVVLCLIAGIGFLLLASRCQAQNQATQSSPSTPVRIASEPDGVLVTTPFDKLRLTVCGPNLIHVVASPDGNAADATPRQPWMVSPTAACGGAKFTLHMPEKTAATASDSSIATLDTGTLQVRISLAFGNLEFFDAHGKRLLGEFQDAPRRYQPETVNGEPLYRVMDQFYPEVREGFYGLGQHQNGVFNDRGTIMELGQANTDVAIPLMVSTNGYGIFWNTAAVSYFDNRFASELRFRANAAHAIDYYFLYGPEMDSILHTYRDLTGHAPLFPEWAYGFFQSKDRYKTQQELLQIAQEYRRQHVPLDAIVQDWQWWVHQGDPTFLPDAYPDVPGTLRQLHDEHVHAMISVWGVLAPQSQNYKEMLQRGFLIPGTTDYDPTNPAAGDFYWNHLVSKLLAQGWDAFWLDATEPEIASPHGADSNTSLEDHKLFIGNGALYTNIFPLMHTGIVYQHWRASGSDKRVFLLTRSAFAGEQRNAATTWSGDVYSTFTSLQRQVPAGLNFMLSGMPYWTTDIGGYGPPYARDTRDPAYQELYVRWFEYGTFCPIFRTHGHRANDTNELFSYGPVAPILIRYDKLRYRLMPYIYSLAWKVTNEDGTIMRPLVMDWRTDSNVWNIGDQFMFGPALLVNPVTHRGMQSRWLYLPPAAAWYDFWTGKKLPGAQHIEAAAPLDQIPLYVKAGSILPMGPEIEYTRQMPDAPIDLRIYRGADGAFTLYEDQGNSYAYEKGAHAIIPLQWNDATQTLTIGARAGTFPGMAQHREFHIILVGENHGTGEEIASNPDKTVAYDGAPVEVSLK